MSAVLDYGGKKIIAWKLGTSNNNHLVAETFNQIENQLLPHKTLIHSDRGYQYTSHWFKEYVEIKLFKVCQDQVIVLITGLWKVSGASLRMNVIEESTLKLLKA